MSIPAGAGVADDASIVRRFHEAFGRGDLDEAGALMHPDCAIDAAGGLPFSGLFHGPQGFADLDQEIAGYLTGSPQSVFTNTEAGVAGRIAIIFKSVHTGRELETRILETYTVKDGKIASIDVYYKDPAALREMIMEGAATVGRAGLDYHGIVPEDQLVGH